MSTQSEKSHNRCSGHDRSKRGEDSGCGSTQQACKQVEGLDCCSVATRRIRYYTGRYLTAHDFRQEQGYFRGRHQLHNRLLHGWGTVCGLGVEPHPDPNCANHVIVQPGIAIDCCGREIILEKLQIVEVWDPDHPPQPLPPSGADHEHDERQAAQAEQAQRPPRACEPPEQDQFEPAYLIYICYSEHESEFAPALYDDGTCSGHECGQKRLEANRICEGACIRVIPWTKENQKRYPGCWPAKDAELPPCRDDCRADPDAPLAGCVEPCCTCELCVPLALVKPRRGNHGIAIIQESLDFTGRRDMTTPPGYLTHIHHVNWPHGGSLSLGTLREEMDGELRVTFDRKLQQNPSDPEQGMDAVGINAATFVVQVHSHRDVQYPMALLHTDGEPPHLENDGCTAVFKIDRALLEGYQNLTGSLLHIILRCDFVLDCHGRPVDGEHLKGALPSGNGRAGGTFESWFWVTKEE
jgi:hypothetical protein